MKMIQILVFSFVPFAFIYSFSADTIPSRLELGLQSNTNGNLITFKDGTSTLFTVFGNFSGTGSTSNGIEIKDFWGHEVMTWRSGNVGVGITNPLFNVHVRGNKGLLVQGVAGDSVSMNPGEGVRMHFYPQKKAFRAGEIVDYGYGEDEFWDHNFIGEYSVAFGRNTLASGKYAMAVGNFCSAKGDESFSIGSGSQSDGTLSIAMGQASTEGDFSTAIGHSVYANGNHCTVLGGSITLNGYGSFGIGDGSTYQLTKGTKNRFYARFNEGYYLYTDSISTIGAVLYGSSAWSYFSDSTRKENFLLIDGEEILEKISKFKLGTWNYVGQDPSKYRHYGPMAQDFFAAFGNDQLGEIGCDTLIGSSDMDGVNFIAIQALEKRTDSLQKEIMELKKMLLELSGELKEIKSENIKLKENKFLLDKSVDKISTTQQPGFSSFLHCSKQEHL